ncbi:MAG TPA: amidohydrolase, partial [Myxococcales bacterium]|nr:amidohydrolase [Myxococcales bacterium]
MSELGYSAFDADHHYYEAEDAFIRHVDPRMRRRCMQWAEIDGRKRLLVGGKINRFIPNPTFDPVALPGSLDQFFRGRNPEGKSMRELFGRLEPISPAYRDREARLEQMDSQGIGGAFLFPTLGVGMQESLRHDPEAACAAFSGFNRWLEEDWGFAYRDRLFAAPYISLMDPEWAASEVDSLIERGARLISMVPGPVPIGEGSRSMAD